MAARYYQYEDLEVSNGNLKIGNDTLIFNLTSAEDCPSRALGLCTLPGRCYARKAERLYPGCLPYRRRQAEYWESTNPLTIFSNFIDLLHKYPSLKRVKYVRFNECGDFRSQTDIDTLDLIADLINMELKSIGRQQLIWYGYSARSDLDFSFCKTLLVKGSEHNQGNNGRVYLREQPKKGLPLKTENTFALFGRHVNVCPGKCYGCSICKTADKQDLIIPLH